MELLERVSGVGRVDRENHIVYGVKICGTESLNGYAYSEDALREAAHLYEGKTVNLSHPVQSEARRDRGIMESPGWLQNVRYERDGLYGDLCLFESHPATALILEKAEKNPKGFGLSHNADGTQARVRNRLTVTKISEVRSVDIVGVPATTAGLFESVQAENASLFEAVKRELLEEQIRCEKLRHEKLLSEQPEYEKTCGEMLLEQKQFGRVLNPESEYDQARNFAESGGEYDRVRKQL